MSAEEEAEFLQRVYSRLPTANCRGCTDCATRCIGNLKITRTEFEAIRDYLGGEIFRPVLRRAGQMATPCEFSDPNGPRCMIYPVRPLICRLFGLVEWLPCPRGRDVTLVPDGPEIFSRYRRYARRSFREWMRRTR